MKFKVPTKAFKQAVDASSRAANGKNPTAGMLLLKAGGGQVSVEGMNEVMRITAAAEAEVLSEGRAAVSADQLKALLQKVVADSTEVEDHNGGGENCVAFRAGRVSARMNRWSDGSPFERVEEALDKGAAQLPAAQVVRQAKQVMAFAKRQDQEGKPVLEGIRIRAEDGRITLEAADGFRMSLSTAALPEDRREARLDALPPAAALAEAVRNIRGEAPEFTITGGTEGRTVQLLVSETGDLLEVEILSSQMAQTSSFPNLREMIPQSWDSRFTVDSADFKRAVEEAMIFANRENRTAILETRTPQGTAANSILTVHGRSPENGEVKDEIPLGQQVEGEDAWIAMRCQFLAEAIEAAGTDEVNLELSGENGPLVVRQRRDDGEESEVIIVMMPLMIKPGTENDREEG